MVLTATTTWVFASQEFSNSSTSTISGLKYTFNFADTSGLTVVSAIDQAGNSLAVSNDEVTGLSIAPQSNLIIYATIGVDDLDDVGCPIEIYGELRKEATDTIITNEARDYKQYQCTSCADIAGCADGVVSASFTPVVNFGTPGNFAPVYTTQVGRQHTIGNVRFLNIDLDFNTNAYTTATGDFLITGVVGTPANDTALTISKIDNVNVGGNTVIGAEINTSGEIKIILSNTGRKASNIITFTGNAVDTETLVIGGVTYTFLDIFVDAGTNVHIGASASETIDNLISAITGVATGAAVEGTDFPTGVTVNTDVSAYQGAGDTMFVEALQAGAADNAVATTETLTNASWATATLAGGLDAGASKAADINEVVPSTSNVKLTIAGFFEIS